MCNYFGFVVMLIAAHDILHQEKTSNRGNQVWFELGVSEISNKGNPHCT